MKEIRGDGTNGGVEPLKAGAGYTEAIPRPEPIGNRQIAEVLHLYARND